MTGVRFSVHGKAEPRGSKTKTSWGIRDSNPKSKPWMNTVGDRAAEAMAALGLGILDGPVEVWLAFYRPRPKGHYTSTGKLTTAAQRNPFPTTAPDCTKLARAVEDAMIGIVYRDDAQIVSEHIHKRFGDPMRVEIKVQLMDVEIATEARIRGTVTEPFEHTVKIFDGQLRLVDTP